MKPDKRIIEFIDSQKNLSIGTSVNNIPHCASCFYAYNEEGNYVIFKSDKKTTHISNALSNPMVAGSVLPNIEKVGTIKGIQFTGIFKQPEGNLLQEAKNIYYSKYPFARAIGGDIWIVEFLSIKMTDNTLGFGKKLIWEKKI